MKVINGFRLKSKPSYNGQTSYATFGGGAGLGGGYGSGSAWTTAGAGFGTGFGTGYQCHQQPCANSAHQHGGGTNVVYQHGGSVGPITSVRYQSSQPAMTTRTQNESDMAKLYRLNAAGDADDRACEYIDDVIAVVILRIALHKS